MDLQADSVQGVLFLTPGQQQDDALKLWGLIFPGDSPDGFQRSSPSPSLLSTSSGERNGHRVTVNAQVGRVDIFLHQPSAVADPRAGPARLADVPAAATRLAQILKKLAERSKVIRTAIILDLIKPVANGAERAELTGLLPGFPLPLNASDVSIQFNSRRSFASIPDVEMNRLCVWNTGQLAFVPNQPAQGSTMMILSPIVGVKVDVNSAPEASLSAENTALAIDEILDESIAIYSTGVRRFEE